MRTICWIHKTVVLRLRIGLHSLWNTFSSLCLLRGLHVTICRVMWRSRRCLRMLLVVILRILVTKAVSLIELWLTKIVTVNINDVIMSYIFDVVELYVIVVVYVIIIWVILVVEWAVVWRVDGLMTLEGCFIRRDPQIRSDHIIADGWFLLFRHMDVCTFRWVCILTLLSKFLMDILGY